MTVPEVTILVPAYNEVSRLPGVVRDIVTTMKATPHGYRILVLDDGSTDGSEVLTWELCAAGPVEVIRHPVNRGKGAVLSGVLPTLTGRAVVVIDADGEYPPAHIPQVVAPLMAGQADVVLGSRYGFGRRVPHQYRGTRAVNRMLNGAFRLLSGRPVQDLLTGLYGFTTEIVRGVHLRETRFAYTPELMWALLGARRGRLCEVPVSYRFRTYAEGKKIRWWETFTLLAALLRYRVRRAGPGPGAE